MTLSLDLQNFDLEQLNTFLMSEGAPEDCMELSELDGFLTAIAISPDLIVPSEGTPWSRESSRKIPTWVAWRPI